MSDRSIIHFFETFFLLNIKGFSLAVMVSSQTVFVIEIRN